MSALIRQIAVLSIMWAMCELLLPAGRQRHMVRMTVSVLVMTALLSTAGEVLQSGGPDSPALAQQAVQAAENNYLETALRAAANQAAGYCERLARRSGYQAQANVFLNREGGVERIELYLEEKNALLSRQEVARRIAQQLQIDQSCIRFPGSQAVLP